MGEEAKTALRSTLQLIRIIQAGLKHIRGGAEALVASGFDIAADGGGLDGGACSCRHPRNSPRAS